MEWLAENSTRGDTILWCIVFAIAAAGFWLGRKKLLITIPTLLAFLFLAAIAIPSFLPARPMAYRNTCINNLHQIRDAKNAWAKKYNKLPTDIPTGEDLYGTNVTNGFLRHNLVCPRGGKYSIGAVGENPTCSFADKGHKLE